MKPFVLKTALWIAASIGVATAHADATDFAGEVGDTVESIFGSPVGQISNGINDGLRTLKDTTTVKGDVDVDVEVGNVTQRISGGERNINELNVGSVSGGSYIDGGFEAEVNVGNIRQTVSGTQNRNRANIGSVTD